MNRNNQSGIFAREENLKALHAAYADGNLALYLGAGVSVANGLPPWDQLVLAMYFAAISPQPMGGWRPFPNYLFAIAEWHLKRGHEPLEITARKIQECYSDKQRFLENLRQTLYAGYATNGAFQPLQRQALRRANPTLDAVAKLCETTQFGKKGVRAVISYNYDELLEAALGSSEIQPIWNSAKLEPLKLPIYHVHGYVPMKRGKGSTPQEIIFTEEQYHLVAQDSYSWSNLVQIQCLSGSTGLMIGLSLSDPNMRRLLDAITSLPYHPENYALITKPQRPQPSDEDLDLIQENAVQYKERFERSGVKGGVKQEWRQKITGILSQVERLDLELQTKVLNQMGIKPIWYDDHAEIPGIIAKIARSPSRRQPSRN
jgi:hypothetical protein